MSRIEMGEVEIELSGQKKVLRPTTRAALAISRRFDGFTNAAQHLAAFDMDALVFVIEAGLGLKEQEAKDLASEVFITGVAALATPAIRYVGMLSNGGRPMKDDQEGNAAAAA